ncbi:MAG: family 16 glycosylhydrolase [Acidobacteriaceae bacterium]
MNVSARRAANFGSDAEEKINPLGTTPTSRQRATPIARRLPAAALAVFCITVLTVAAPAQSPWKLAWSDEFNGQRGAPPNPAAWTFETGPGASFGNQEAEFYCADGSSQPPCNPNAPNAYLDGNGHLVLVAVKTATTITVGPNKTVSPVYTSARLSSVKDFRYGRIEASLRLPTAQPGVWPAFWALGHQTATVRWPANGEIDIMEQWNPVAGHPDQMDPLAIHGSTHGPKSPGSAEGYLDQTATFTFPGVPSGGLHQYAVEWEPGEVDFYVDGYLYSQQSVGSLTGSDVYELDRGPFALLLNLAMGGGFFGYPNASTGPTPTLVADYVRVYQRDPAALPSGWGNADIGGPSQPGSSTFASGVWTVAGSGYGIAGRFDQFQFLYHSLGGDGEVSAHVLDQTSKVAEAKAGVMLREGRGVASPFAMMFISPDGSTHFRCRLSQGAVPDEVLYKAPASWLKINRTANTFTGYVSTDGKTWNAVGSVKIPMPVDVDAGLIATSRDNATPNTVRFDYVDLSNTDAAFDGHAATIPGVIQAERFDTGTKGYSYSADFGDTGPNIAEMPDHSGTDNSAGGHYLTHLKSNRYINYAVNVTKEGKYHFTVRVASAGPGGSFHYNVDQKSQFAPVLIPDTGGDLLWKEITTPSVHLTAGHHIIALVTDASGPAGHIGNIDLFAVQPN